MSVIAATTEILVRQLVGIGPSAIWLMYQTVNGDLSGGTAEIAFNLSAATDKRPQDIYLPKGLSVRATNETTNNVTVTARGLWSLTSGISPIWVISRPLNAGVSGNTKSGWTQVDLAGHPPMWNRDVVLGWLVDFTNANGQTFEAGIWGLRWDALALLQEPERVGSLAQALSRQ